MAKSYDYYGDVEVTVKMRYRIAGPFSKKQPTAAMVLKALRNEDIDDVMDTEELKIVSVDKVGENLTTEDEQ